MNDVPRVSPEELHRRMLDGEDVVIVDVRRGSYDESDEKVQGALRIDPEAYERDYRRIPQGSRVVTYCTWPHEATSARVAQFLNQQGYRAEALAGGFEAWQEAGYPTEPK